MASTDDLRAWVTEVAGGGLRAREEAMSRLLDERLDPLIGFLLETIEQDDYALRNAAIEVLSRLGPVAISALSTRVDSISEAGKMFIAPAIAEYRDARVLPWMHRWLGSDDPNLVATTCEALGKLGFADSIPVLRDVVDADPWMAGPALTAMGRIGHESALPELRSALQDEDLAPFALEAMGILGDPGGWPDIAATVKADPSMASLALASIAPVFRRLGPDSIVREAAPSSLWIAAARGGLEKPDSRYASTRILGAFGDHEAIPRMIDLYIREGDDESIPLELSRLDGAPEILEQAITYELNDEESQRVVRLLFALNPGGTDHALFFLAHPSPAVRLEMVLHLGVAGGKYLEPLTGMLADPDPLVRRSTLQTLKTIWKDPETADAIAREIDLQSLEPDVLENLAQEAPDTITRRIETFLASRGQERAPEEETVLLYLEVRNKPAAMVGRMREKLGYKEMSLTELEAICNVAGTEVAELLAEIALNGDRELRYPAAEALFRHPDHTREQLQALIQRSREPGVLAVAAAWVELTGDSPGLDLLAQLPPQTEPQVEWQILRALSSHGYEPAAERFERATGSSRWYVQAEALRGQLAVNQRTSASLATAQMDPLAREVLTGQAESAL